MAMRSVMLIILLGVCVAQTSLRAEQSSTDPIKQAVEQSLQSQSIRDVVVTTDNGVLTLTGTVPTLWMKDRAREVAWSLYHDGAVHDDLVVTPCEADARLANDVRRNIRHYVFFSVFDAVEASVERCQVTLNGSVSEPFRIEEFDAALSRVAGVQSIHDAVRWLPATGSDRRLQHAVAGRIYGDERFWQCSFQPNPPIHIVASEGVITLSGSLPSQAEIEAAEAICRTVPGVRDCDNRLRVQPPAVDDRGEGQWLPERKTTSGP